ncbi:MAG: endonuclease/exonuclease/phosphatase family protein, partial [Candidatus Limnocylindrales bacterium]
FRALAPQPGVFGVGVLSRLPLTGVEAFKRPSGIQATIEWEGMVIVALVAHPLPATITTATALRIPTGFNPGERDARLATLRARIDALLGAERDVLVLADFNTATTEPAYADLLAGLRDAHVEVGQGPGWSWRPSRFEGLPIGLLRIDLILASPRLEPVASRVRCPPIGDHCIVSADLVGLR